MACTGPHADQILILPFDLCGPYSDLEAAAHSADQAFEGAGIDYIIHNAGSYNVLVNLLHAFWNFVA